MARQITDPDVLALASIAATLIADYVLEGEDDPWAGSPFAWIKTRPSRQVGKIGEQLVAGLCAAKGFDVTRCVGSQADRMICNQDYSICICLGLAPFDASMWVIPKSVLLDKPKPQGVVPQHGGGAGSDTHWLSFDASHPYEWMKLYGGTLKEAIAVLRKFEKNR